jgi:hypothetical protein
MATGNYAGRHLYVPNSLFHRWIARIVPALTVDGATYSRFFLNRRKLATKTTTPQASNASR